MAGLLACGVAVGSASAGPSAVITVANNADSGSGSLREAIAQSNGTTARETIQFANTVASPIVLTSGQLELAAPVSIEGPGPRVMEISGNDASRVFLVNAGVDAEISGVAITNGSVVGDPGGSASAIGGDGNAGTRRAAPRGGPPLAPGGAGIRNEGSLVLEDVVVSDNVVASGAGGNALAAGGNGGAGQLTNGGDGGTGTASGGSASPTFGGGIFNTSGASLTISDSDVSGNSAFAGDGGSASASGGNGGRGGSQGPGNGGNGRTGLATGGNGGATSGAGIASAGTLSIGRTSIVDNTAEAGDGGDANASGGNGGSGGDGGSGSNGGNGGFGGASTAESGDGGDATGGGLASTGQLTIVNSTFAGNEVQNGSGGGGSSAGGLGGAGGNSGAGGEFGGRGGDGGSANAEGGTGGSASGGGISTNTATLRSLTVASNSAPSAANIEVEGGTATIANSIVANPERSQSCGGTLTSQGYNLDQDSSCSLAATGDLSGVNPGLATIRGRTPQFLRIDETSPAFDTGDAGDLDTDTRGRPRPVDFPDTANATDGDDIGAYEFQGRSCDGRRTLSFATPGQPFTGTPDNDVIAGVRAPDQISAGAGNDRVCSLNGDDVVLGEAGNDSLNGGVGDDILTGGGGKDTLKGLQGNDTLDGSRGKDVLRGGPGRDTCIVGRADEARGCERIRPA